MYRMIYFTSVSYLPDAGTQSIRSPATRVGTIAGRLHGRKSSCSVPYFGATFCVPRSSILFTLLSEDGGSVQTELRDLRLKTRGKLAEAPGSRTQPAHVLCAATGFEDREGHRAPFASVLLMMNDQ